MHYRAALAFVTIVTTSIAGCDDSDSRIPSADGAVASGDANVGDVTTAPTSKDADVDGIVPTDVALPVDASADAAAICGPAAIGCDGAEMTVCSGDGSPLRRIPCANGCDNTAATAACKPAPLNTGWTLYAYNPVDDGMKIQPKYVFENDGLVAVQSANSLPSAYVNDMVLENVTVTGRFSVETSSDDDYIGFVFGWQDKEHFYLVRWKQARQSYCGGIAEEGVSLVAVSSPMELTVCDDFWASAGTDRVKVLTPASANPNGWVDRVLYEFTLSYKPGNTKIEIREAVGGKLVAQMASTDTTYPRGKFGFYNHSQQDVRYQFFSISLAP